MSLSKCNSNSDIRTYWVIFQPYLYDYPYGAYVQDGNYKYDGEDYKVLTENLNNAKLYSSYTWAYKAANRFIDKFVNFDSDYDILEVEVKNGIVTLC